jgi:hypothetical protein
MQPPPSPVVLEYLDLDTPALALPTSSLDSVERERAARFHFDEDRRRFIHGRAWLRLRVAELLGIDPKAVEFTTIGERGKPTVASKLAPTGAQSIVGGSLLPTGTVPTFNLSHSAQHGLLALLPRLADDDFAGLTRLLFDQAQLTEQGQIDNPGDFVRRLNQLLVKLAPAAG